MALNETIVDDVANTNFKVIAGMPALVGNMLSGNIVSHNRAMDHLREDRMSLANKRGTELDSVEAVANRKVASGDLAEILAQFKALATEVSVLANKTN